MEKKEETAAELAKRQIAEKKPGYMRKIITLNYRREQFCQNFCSPNEFFGNGTQSYMDAYKLDPTSQKDLVNARTSAYDLLKNPAILKRIDELLQDGGLNNSSVDKQLQFLITQKAEMGTSLGAIKEYNKLKGRITDKLKIQADLALKFNISNPVDQESIKKIE